MIVFVRAENVTVVVYSFLLLSPTRAYWYYASD